MSFKNGLIALQLLLFLGLKASFANSLDEFARTGKQPEIEVDLWEASASDPKLYKKMFMRSLAPKVDDFRGQVFRGMITYLHGGPLGKFILNGVVTHRYRDFFLGRQYTRPLVFEDRFMDQDNDLGHSGVNFLPIVGYENLPMKIYNGPSFMDPEGVESMKIDYRVPGNSKTLGATIDELRQIPGTDLYIGRSFSRLGKKRIPVLWFFMKKHRPYVR